MSQDTACLLEEKLLLILQKSETDYQEKALARDNEFKDLELMHTAVIGWLATILKTKSEFLSEGRAQFGSRLFDKKGCYFAKAAENFERLKRNFIDLKQKNQEFSHVGGVQVNLLDYWNDTLPKKNDKESNDTTNSD